MFQFLTKAAGNILGTPSTAPRTPKPTRLTMETLEDRTVPAYLRPVHVITPQMSAALVQGESSLRRGDFQTAKTNFLNVYNQAVSRHDAETLLRLAADYRDLGKAAGPTWGGFKMEKDAFDNAEQAARFHAVYDAYTPGSGSDRAYGIRMLGECISRYPALNSGIDPIYNLDQIKADAKDALDTLNQQHVHDVLNGYWYTEAGHQVYFRTNALDARFLWLFESHKGGNWRDDASTTLVSRRITDDLVTKSGAWNATSTTFSFNGCNSLVTGSVNLTFTFSFDPTNSGRMLVRDSEGKTVEVYRDWDAETRDDAEGRNKYSGKIDVGLNNLTPADAAQALTHMSWQRRISELDRMTPQRVSQIIWNYSWPDLTNALNHMTAARVSQVIWNYNWTGLTNTLNHMNAQRVSQVVWNYSWTNMTSTLDHMTSTRAAEVAWNYNWTDLTNTFNHMTAKRASEVVWNYNPTDRTSTFNHMTVARAADVIKQYEPARQTVVLNAMAPQRKHDIQVAMNGRVIA
ncbi:MAG: hypothetical protein U0797_22105 [Gemmataceae bacterium]